MEKNFKASLTKETLSTNPSSPSYIFLIQFVLFVENLKCGKIFVNHTLTRIGINELTLLTKNGRGFGSICMLLFHGVLWVRSGVDMYFCCNLEDIRKDYRTLLIAVSIKN